MGPFVTAIDYISALAKLNCAPPSQHMGPARSINS
jgi:hypothetical protein